MSGPKVFFMMVKPSSLYKPTLFLPTIVDSLEKRNRPTSAHISAASNEHMVASKSDLFIFFSE